MDRIWAPWRKAYIRADRKPRKGCLFCGLLKEKKDVRNYILARTEHSFAILNLYPYNNGHTLIIPRRHVPDLSDLKPEEKLDLLELCEKVKAALATRMKAHGFNLGINLGASAGAGLPEHLHLHVVPRWRGDANFMPVVGATKVISESLDSVYQELSQQLKAKKDSRH